MDVAAYAKQAAAANPMPFTNVPAPVEGLVLHVDGDYCAYYCSGNDECEPGQARRNLIEKINQLKWVSGATRVIVHLTARQSNKGKRYLVATVKPYQGQRQSGRKPRNWEMLREYMEGYEGDQFTVKQWINREADDGIAYVARVAADAGKLAVIATADKDMRMLPGRHIIWKTNQIIDVPSGAFDLVGPDGDVYGHKWFWLQLLQGDSADNIPGLESVNGKRIGPKTADDYLRHVSGNSEAFLHVASLYAAGYGDSWKDRFVEQASLLWLRTDRYANLTDFAHILPEGHGLDTALTELHVRVLAKEQQLKELQ